VKKYPQIYFYNTLSNSKEAFKPLEEGKVRIYACGVTVYDHYHIGHALQAIYFDVLKRFLSYLEFKVTYVRNYTDVDDKIIQRAKSLGISPRELADQMIESSEQDMTSLGCLRADFSPKVSTSIPEIVAMIEDLIKKDFAYVTQSGDVYYRVRKKIDYGKLSNRRIDELAPERDIVSKDKEDELDFALWKHDESPDASWPSPFGQGRPGWHIECSAMSKMHLGSSFDIHGGGRDLVFPHHENEIAQSEAANDAPYASVWMHSGLLTIEHQKMSKSLGNHIGVKEFLHKWPQETLRLAFLSHHYRSNIDFKSDSFKLAHQRLCYYFETLKRLEQIEVDVDPTGDFDDLRSKFIGAMCDDFHTGAALAEINKSFKKANELLRKAGKNLVEKKQAFYVFRELLAVLGIDYSKERLNQVNQLMLTHLGVSQEWLDGKIKERELARSNKDYAASDKIREELLAKGIELCDTPTGCEYRIVCDELN
jgi:cysteinyl-tRNA synthetase